MKYYSGMRFKRNPKLVMVELICVTRESCGFGHEAVALKTEQWKKLLFVAGNPRMMRRQRTGEYHGNGVDRKG